MVLFPGGWNHGLSIGNSYRGPAAIGPGHFIEGSEEAEVDAGKGKVPDEQQIAAELAAILETMAAKPVADILYRGTLDREWPIGSMALYLERFARELDKPVKQVRKRVAAVAWRLGAPKSEDAVRVVYAFDDFRLGETAWMTVAEKGKTYRKIQGLAREFLAGLDLNQDPEAHARMYLFDMEMELLQQLYGAGDSGGLGLAGYAGTKADYLEELSDSVDSVIRRYRKWDFPEGVRRGRYVRGIVLELKGEFDAAIWEYELAMIGASPPLKYETQIRIGMLLFNKLFDYEGAKSAFSLDNIMKTPLYAYVNLKACYAVLGLVVAGEYEAVRKLDAGIKPMNGLLPLMKACQVAAAIAMEEPDAAGAYYQEMLAALNQAPATYGIPYGMDGVVNHLEAHPAYQKHREWMVGIFEALGSGRKAEIIKGLERLSPPW